MFSTDQTLPRLAAPCCGSDEEGSSTVSPRHSQGMQDLASSVTLGTEPIREEIDFALL